MKIESLLKNLRKLLEKVELSDSAKCERIDDLLVQLQSKEERLKKKLKEKSDSKKYKRLKTELKIVQAQLKKGKKRRKELTAKCG
jgi:DNA-binding transcriptional MerR regulator